MNFNVIEEATVNQILTDLKEIKTILNKRHTQTLSDQWLDVKESCKYLKVSSRSLQTYRDEGRIPFSQIGHKIYFKVTDLDNYLNKHMRTAFNNKH